METGVFNERREVVDNAPAFFNRGWSSSYNDPMQWLDDGIFSSDPNFRSVSLWSLEIEPFRQYADLAAQALAEQDAAKQAQLNAEIDAFLRTNAPAWVQEFSGAVDEAKVALDPTVRQDALSRAQQVLSDNVFAIPLVTTKAIGLLKPWVKDPFFHPLLPTRPLYMDMTYIQRA